MKGRSQLNVNLEGLPALLQKVTFASLLPALIYLIIGVIIIRIVMHAVARALSCSSVDKTLHKFLLTLTKVILWFVLFMTVAGALGIQITSFVAILSVAGLALSLSLQGVLGNLASGLMLLSVKPFKVGDFVEVAGLSGTVDEIGFIYTRLRMLDNRIIFLPNSAVSGSTLTNYTKENIRRVDFVFKAAYDYDPETAKQAILAAGTGLSKVLKEPAPFVSISGFTDAGPEFTARFWCATDDYWDVYFGVYEALLGEYKKHGVAMSYPNVNVHLDK